MRLSRYPMSLRLRLTFWYAGAMVVVLALYAATVFLFVRQSASQALDAELRSDFQWPREMLDRLPDGSIAPYYEIEDSASSPWLQVWSLDGELLYHTRNAEQNPVPNAIDLAREASDRVVVLQNMVPTMRVLSAVSRIGGEDVVIQVAESEFAMQRNLHDLMLILALGLPLSVVAAGFGGYSLARRALAPVDRMAERARAITAERLTERLPVGNPEDELGRLATVFNETLTRLESSFEQMKRFIAHASHELRTPLTAIRSVGEVGLRHHRDESGYRDVIGSMLEEVDRLAQLVDRLLILSRIESGPLDLATDRVDLSDLAQEVAGQLEVLAEERHQTIETSKARGLVWMGDRMLLRQALLNLVDNGIKYTPAGGRITIRVGQSGEQALVEVADTGPGISEEHRARVFDKFYRIDESRAQVNGGSGLGLSIAKWAVEACGGCLTLERAEANGSTFRITLPTNITSHRAPVGDKAMSST